MEIASALQDPMTTRVSFQWAALVCEAHATAMLTHDSFTTSELNTLDRMAPRGNIIFSAGDPASVVDDLPPQLK
jgi:hypothetical protein